MNLQFELNQKDLYIDRLERENVRLKRMHPEEIRQKDNVQRMYFTFFKKKLYNF